MIFSICSLIGLSATAFLPETLGKSLPQSLIDANNISKKICYCADKITDADEMTLEMKAGKPRQNHGFED